MRVFVAGASGVIGRSLLPMLEGHVVFGMTRNRPDLVRALGAEPVVADVYDRERMLAAVSEAQPEVVVNLLTDLGGRDFAANARMRRVGATNLVDAAVAAKVRRLVVESISFRSSPEGDSAVAEMERTAQASGLDAIILRLARLWGPGTWHDERSEREPQKTGGEFIHVHDAACIVRDAVLRSP
jgi:nucleoside-diphosphate-sugar epimerase